jgi:hypothetical protein
LANPELERVSLVQQLKLTVKDENPGDNEQDGGDKA